jgi:uncharacterized protein with von Willebrand factor type A (vWA) domain
MATVLKVFDKWKEFLADRVSQAERAGMNEETLNKIAFQIGDFLANKIDPENTEERVLKELWDIGSEEDRRTIAKLMVKLVDKA